MNKIVNLKTITAQSADGPIPVIVMGLNIAHVDQADAFIAEVAQTFKNQRMCSPPDTRTMLITLVSPMPIERFTNRWRQLAGEDPILAFFMSQMQQADILRGTVAGVTLESASLVEATPEA